MRVDVKTKQLERALKTAVKKCKDTRSIFNDIGEHLLRSVNKNFQEQGRPERWQKLSKQYAATRKSGKILTITRSLQNSITKKATSKEAVVGTNKKYAPIHQFGGQTKPRTIKPRRANALRFYVRGKPVFAKSVNHPGSKIPARPFLVVQDEDYEAFSDIVQDHIVGGF